MTNVIKSIIIWFLAALLMLGWFPVLLLVRLFDNDPGHYRTGYLFRKLGKAITRLNPGWNITLSGHTDIDDRHPYIMVCNHLSNADIPLISTLPWDMKWVAKKELFGIPVVGWMMRLAGDIPVDRKSSSTRIGLFRKIKHYLDNNCSVMFFPEGTRSRSGNLRRFSDGAFTLAIRSNTPILPLVLDGTQSCLPKNSWKFGKAKDIRLKVLDPVDTTNYTNKDIQELKEKIRANIRNQLMEWRGASAEEVDDAL